MQLQGMGPSMPVSLPPSASYPAPGAGPTKMTPGVSSKHRTLNTVPPPPPPCPGTGNV